MRELLDRAPANDAIWDLLDRNGAIRYAQEKGALKNKVDPARQIMSGILWALEQPTPPGVNEVQDLPMTFR
jgi:hypothetical protein